MGRAVKSRKSNKLIIFAHQSLRAYGLSSLEIGLKRVMCDGLAGIKSNA